jgi:hypothetical protein
LGLLAGEYKLDAVEGLSSPSRQYFANVLIESDCAILQAHLRGVRHILELLRRIREGDLIKKDLLLTYQESWSKESEERQASNRIFVSHYYHQLNNFLPV